MRDIFTFSLQKFFIIYVFRYQTESSSSERRLINSNSDSETENVTGITLLFARTRNASNKTSRLVNYLTVACRTRLIIL